MLKFPTHIQYCNTAINGKTIPDKLKPINAIHQFEPETFPIAGGKIKFPDPKNNANNARPTIILCFILVDMLPTPLASQRTI